MNNYSPYDEELKKQLKDLPLPDEDISWEDMQRRLKADDDNPPIIPPVFKGCGGIAFLLLLLAIVALVFLHPKKWFQSASQRKAAETTINENKNNVKEKFINLDKNKAQKQQPSKKSNSIADSSITSIKESLVAKELFIDKENVSLHQRKKSDPKRSHYTIKTAHLKSNSRNQKNDDEIKNGKRQLPVNKKIKERFTSTISSLIETDTAIIERQNSSVVNKNISIIDTVKSIINLSKKITTITDSIKNNTIKKTDTAAQNKTAILKEKNIYFSAGLGLFQLVPVAGQNATPYNSLGRINSLADYIPSIYFRMNKDKKWFFQSEFRYGAPQYNKELLFSQKKVTDTITNLITATDSRLKKTFYHQLPLSFNYFIRPGLSVGAGVSFNKFSAAVVDEEVRIINTVTQFDSLASKGIISQQKADSIFVSFYTQALIEMQYQRKRFSTGVRYSFGLQPYIKFNLPGGQQRQEKNSSLQLFIRFQLWQSKKPAKND